MGSIGFSGIVFGLAGATFYQQMTRGGMLQVGIGEDLPIVATVQGTILFVAYGSFSLCLGALRRFGFQVSHGWLVSKLLKTSHFGHFGHFGGLAAGIMYMHTLRGSSEVGWVDKGIIEGKQGTRFHQYELQQPSGWLVKLSAELDCRPLQRTLDPAILEHLGQCSICQDSRDRKLSAA